LRVGRHLDGFVDAYVGPSEWAGSVAEEDLAEPTVLRDEAAMLLDGLEDVDLEDDRRRWLRGQLGAVACVAARLAGEEFAWADEVERCFGVRPARTDASVLEVVHRRLEDALPGPGTVRERFTTWDETNAIPRERLIPTLERLNEVLRPRAHALAPMPAEESVTYELVSGVPWIAFNRYEGRYRSRVEVNTDLPISICLLTGIAAHESYPGHHTERAAKESRLYRDRGRVETCVAISAAPEALVSEGLAMIALEEALGPRPFEVVAELVADEGVRFDPTEAHEFRHAEVALYDAATNAAFLLHEEGAPTEEVEAYVREWALESDARAARTVAFLTDPSSRAYVTAYPDGRRLCRAFADRVPGNFARLLTEQLAIADLLP
jgi:hypothetical protein